jgi:hypothetical protein
MYFATTIAERRSIGKEKTLLGRWENLQGEKKKRRNENTVKHTQRKKYIRRNMQRDNLSRRYYAKKIDKNLTKIYNIYNR